MLYMIWQMMTGMLHSNKQQKGCQKPSVEQKTTTELALKLDEKVVNHDPRPKPEV